MIFYSLQCIFHPPDVRSWATLARFPGGDVRATGLEENVCWQCVTQALPSPPISPLPPPLLLASFLKNKGRKSQGVCFPYRQRLLYCCQNLLPSPSVAFFMRHIPTGEAFAVTQITFQGLFFFLCRVIQETCQHLYKMRGVRRENDPETIISGISHLLFKWHRIRSPADVCTYHFNPSLPLWCIETQTHGTLFFPGNNVYFQDYFQTIKQGYCLWTTPAILSYSVTTFDSYPHGPMLSFCTLLYVPLLPPSAWCSALPPFLFSPLAIYSWTCVSHPCPVALSPVSGRETHPKLQVVLSQVFCAESARLSWQNALKQFLPVQTCIGSFDPSYVGALLCLDCRKTYGWFSGLPKLIHPLLILGCHLCAPFLVTQKWSAFNFACSNLFLDKIDCSRSTNLL